MMNRRTFVAALAAVAAFPAYGQAPEIGVYFDPG